MWFLRWFLELIGLGWLQRYEDDAERRRSSICQMQERPENKPSESGNRYAFDKNEEQIKKERPQSDSSVVEMGTSDQLKDIVIEARQEPKQELKPDLIDLEKGNDGQQQEPKVPAAKATEVSIKTREKVTKNKQPVYDNYYFLRNKDLPVVVIDIGAFKTRAGIINCGDIAGLEPTLEFPTVVGKVKGETSDKFQVVGDEAIKRRRQLDPLVYPCADGVGKNSCDTKTMFAMQRIYEHIFDTLQLSPGSCPIILSVPACAATTPISQHQNWISFQLRILFDTFESCAVMLCNSSALGLSVSEYDDDFTHGLSGLAVDVGYSSIEVVPVWENNVLQHSSRFNYGFTGKELNEYLSKKLSTVVPSSLTETDIDKIKMSNCWVKGETLIESPSPNTKVELQDGSVLECNSLSELHEVLEPFFDSDACNSPFYRPPKGFVSLPDLIHQSLMSITDPEILEEIHHGGITLCGGISNIPGFASKLQDSLSKLKFCSFKGKPITVTVNPVPGLASFRGAAYLALTKNKTDICYSFILPATYDIHVEKSWVPQNFTFM